VELQIRDSDEIHRFSADEFSEGHSWAVGGRTLLLVLIFADENNHFPPLNCRIVVYGGYHMTSRTGQVLPDGRKERGKVFNWVQAIHDITTESLCHRPLHKQSWICLIEAIARQPLLLGNAVTQRTG
jgi:hypothetical protein